MSIATTTTGLRFKRLGGATLVVATTALAIYLTIIGLSPTPVADFEAGHIEFFGSSSLEGIAQATMTVDSTQPDLRRIDIALTLRVDTSSAENRWGLLVDDSVIGDSAPFFDPNCVILPNGLGISACAERDGAPPQPSANMSVVRAYATSETAPTVSGYLISGTVPPRSWQGTDCISCGVVRVSIPTANGPVIDGYSRYLIKPPVFRVPMEAPRDIRRLEGPTLSADPANLVAQHPENLIIDVTRTTGDRLIETASYPQSPSEWRWTASLRSDDEDSPEIQPGGTLEIEALASRPDSESRQVQHQFFAAALIGLLGGLIAWFIGLVKRPAAP